MMFRYPCRIAILMFTVVLTACGNADDQATQTAAAEPRMKVIQGTLNYVADIILAPESTVTVELVDVTDATANSPGTVIADTVFHKPGRPPLPFSVKYDANDISGDRQYALRAKIMEQKRLMFITESSYPVFESGPEGDTPRAVKINLTHVPGGHLDRVAGNVRKQNPTLVGHYRYYDKQGEFVDCSDGSSHPVAREAGVYALESEYRDVVIEYGEEVFVSLIGKYATRPARDGRGKEDFLIVLQVEEMTASGACP